MQNLIINADDYAMDAGVDAAILKLAGLGAITAASAMVLSPRWPEAARTARDAPSLSFGLHFDLTSPFACGDFPARSLTALILRAQAGLLGRALLRRQADFQLEAFEKAFGAPPAFADGHQHVHHLPAVREVLLEALEDHYGRDKDRIGLRICVARRWRGVKAEIVARTGARGLSKLALKRGHLANSDFAGVYDFGLETSLPALWRGWATNLEGGFPLIMCHVALRTGDAVKGDPIRGARFREFEWLASEEFRSFCQQSALNPVRWPTA
jgi:chitin disaccharide deacetylase